MLTDCVAPHGLTEWDHFRPALSVAEYAVFYPRHDHYGSLPWGIYDLNGRLNARAALIQEKSNLGHGQEWIAASPRCSMDLPEIESAVYGGMIGLHYGHTLLELLPRLWYLRNVAAPSSKILVHCGPGLATAWNTPWFKELMELVGISPSDLISPTTTTLVRRLLLPEPTFQINHFCMKEFIAFTNTIGDRVAPSTDERPVFLTKKNLSGGVLNCINEDEFCARLESRGFRIESPEHHTLRQQIAFFHNPAGVAGMLGSNMHTSIFSRKAYGLALHVVAHNSNSFYLLDACNQADFRYVTSPSITETEAAPGFRHSFRMEDPAKLADAFTDAFFAQQTEILSKRRASHTPKQSTPMAFYAVRNETGGFLTARHADGKLVVSSEASPLLYPIIAALGQDGKVELFAEAPAPFPITASTTSHWATSISGHLTFEEVEDVHQSGIQHDGKWLTLPPHSDGTEASFRAETQLGWECVTFVELSPERNQTAQRLYDQIHNQHQQPARVSGGFLMA